LFLEKTLIAPSLLSADFSHLAKAVEEVERGGIDWHHVDVMDNHFVPNLAFSPDIQSFLKSLTNKTIDTHLMMTHPKSLVESFVKAGSDIITIHVECKEDVGETLQYIKSFSIKNGISLKPNTQVEALTPYLKDVDLVLVMTVEPGFGGQSFMNEMVKKISWLNDYRKDNGCDFCIEVDGGINVDTGKLCVEAGADVLVAGSYIYKAENISGNIQSLRDLK
jgi:ribulose-phosphate 3-epimerase